MLEQNSHSAGRIGGFFLGLFGASFFGFIPVFAVPLLKTGYSVETVACYRFGLAALALLPFAVRARLQSSQILAIMGLAVFYFLDVLFFFHALNFLSGGIVATLEFLCPVFTVGIMIIFFHERGGILTGIGIALAIAGTALLGLSPDSAATASGHSIGVLLSLLAALCNALYYVGFKWLGPKAPGALASTFFVMLSCALCSLANGMIGGNLQWIAPSRSLLYAISLALVTAVLSNICLIAAIQRIGPTPVSILGVMEPVTAVAAGIVFLGEKSSLNIWLGLFFSILAVLCVLRSAK